MILDASALLAVVLGEPDAGRIAAAMASADVLRMPSATWFEACAVIDRRADGSYTAEFEKVFAEAGIVVEPLTAEHVRIARLAWDQYGRGRHPARLNFGDCMVYGFAKVSGEPLLFKGGDFSQTDIESALKD